MLKVIDSDVYIYGVPVFFCHQAYCALTRSENVLYVLV